LLDGRLHRRGIALESPTQRKEKSGSATMLPPLVPKNNAGLFHLDIRSLHHLFPLVGIFLDQGGELFAR